MANFHHQGGNEKVLKIFIVQHGTTSKVTATYFTPIVGSTDRRRGIRINVAPVLWGLKTATASNTRRIGLALITRVFQTVALKHTRKSCPAYTNNSSTFAGLTQRNLMKTPLRWVRLRFTALHWLFEVLSTLMLSNMKLSPFSMYII